MFIPFFLKFFPLKINNLWIYKVYERFDEKEYSIVKVIIEEKIPFDDKIIYIFGYYLDNEELKKESYIVNNEGLFLYARKLEDNLIVYDPLVSFLPINFDSLSWWSWEGKAGIIPSKIRFENKGFVEEGVFKISYIEENKLGKSNYNLYLKKEVGIIKEESDTPYFNYISELIDYNVDFDDFSMFSFNDFSKSDFSKSVQTVGNEYQEYKGYFEDFKSFQEYEEQEYQDYEEYDKYENLESNSEGIYYQEDISGTEESHDIDHYDAEFEDETLYIDENYKEYYNDDYKSESK